MKNQNAILAVILLLLVHFGLSPVMQAVVPAPDGGYPGGNTAEGTSALLNLTTGTYNTAVGLSSLQSTTTGNFNTATGAWTLLSNTTGNNNNAFGFGALYSNTTGPFNNALGDWALGSNTTGDRNTALGEGAMISSTTGSQNTAVGVSALRNNTIGSDNIAIGQDACKSNGSANLNTGIGWKALTNNTASGNTAVGALALTSNTTGDGNTATGDDALTSNITGASNTADGFDALGSNTGGDANTAVGWGALYANTTGYGNTVVGRAALLANTTGYQNTAIGTNSLGNPFVENVGDLNTAIGFAALGSNISGSGNIAVGAGAGRNVTSATNVICIGADGANASNSCYIGQIFGATSASGTAVFINSDGKLGTTTSSLRFKEEIKPMDKASQALFALKPVTFHYKREIDPKKSAQFGLVAEDVEKANPALVVRDKEGKPYSVRYDQVNAMLLNEFLKEHEKVQELEARVSREQKGFTEQEKRMAALASALQKVSYQLAAASAFRGGIETIDVARRTAGRIHHHGPTPRIPSNNQ